MLTGHQKAQILISILKQQSKDVVSHLSPDAAATLSTLDNAPRVDSKAILDLMGELLTKVDSIKARSIRTEEIETPMDEPEEEHIEEEIHEEPIEEIPEPEPEPEPEEEAPAETSNLREASEIAEILAQQRPQVIAFMLTRTEQPLRDEILNNLPPELMEKLELSEVETVPLGDRVYETLYSSIYEKGGDIELTLS